MNDNIYKPYLMKVADAVDEAPGVRTLRLEFQDAAVKDAFRFKAGQFAEYSAFGAGECAFCIASPPTRRGYVECTFRKTGRVTADLAEAEIGDTVGLRGPYGNSFPIESWEGKSLVFVAGGIGLPPVRCLIWNVLDLRGKFKNVTIVYGAKTIADLVYKRELDEWRKRSDVTFVATVDPGGETPDWKGQVGFVPAVLKQAAPPSSNTVAIVCGPPIMIKFCLLTLNELGFKPDAIYTTMENRMKCGLGKCGRCNIGKLYVCKDGPVFTAAQLKEMPAEY